MARKKSVGGEAGAAKGPELRRGRPPSGPSWHARRGQWMVNIGGKSFYEPKTIGQSDIAGAKRWYRQVAKANGIEFDEDLPGTPTLGGRRLSVTITDEVAERLKELNPLVAAEMLSATANYSRAISVAITEALARRKEKGRPKG